MQEKSILFLTLIIGGILLFGWILLLQKRYTQSLLTQQEKNWMQLLVWEKNLTLEHIGNELHDHVKQLVLLERSILKNLLQKKQELEAQLSPIISLNAKIEQAIDQLVLQGNNDENNGKNFIKLLEELRIYVKMAYRIDLIIQNKYKYYNRPEQSEEIMLYRIFQELIQNTQKHTNANEVVINFNNTDNTMRITYKDNGNIKNIEQEGNNNLNPKGLKSIYTRIQLLQGTYTLDFLPTTKFTLNLPISNRSTFKHLNQLKNNDEDLINIETELR